MSSCDRGLEYVGMCVCGVCGVCGVCVVCVLCAVRVRRSDAYMLAFFNFWKDCCKHAESLRFLAV